MASDDMCAWKTRARVSGAFRHDVFLMAIGADSAVATHGPVVGFNRVSIGHFLRIFDPSEKMESMCSDPSNSVSNEGGCLCVSRDRNRGVLLVCC